MAATITTATVMNEDVVARCQVGITGELVQTGGVGAPQDQGTLPLHHLTATTSAVTGDTTPRGITGNHSQNV